MAANEFRKGDVGTVITATLMDNGSAVDISGVTTKYFLLKQPGGSVTTVTANFVGSGTAGSLRFTTTSAHFDTTGVYRLQVFISDATRQWHTDYYEFMVHPNLD